MDSTAGRYLRHSLRARAARIVFSSNPASDSYQVREAKAVAHKREFTSKESVAKKGLTGWPLLGGWAIHYFLILAICVVVVFIAALPLGKILSYRKETSWMQAEAAKLRQEAQQIRERAEQANSPVFVERIAREKLGLARPGEIVFVPVEGPWPRTSAPSTSTPGSDKASLIPKSTNTSAKKPSPSPSPSTAPQGSASRGTKKSSSPSSSTPKATPLSTPRTATATPMSKG